ncbi:hypothetical protein ACFC58_20910 [Kitasatospora purpeofusca]|uniref:hypothetical protein n=1 Tax=Kitasatospora purpeofusca TaxID=67352 RepID=UPI0035E23D15
MTDFSLGSRRATTLRLAAVAALATVSLGTTGGMAQATEYRDQRAETVKAQVSAATVVLRAAEAPAIQFEGLEDRFAALPISPSLQQVLGAMYPNDVAAQALALQALAGSLPAEGGRQSGSGVQGAQADLHDWVVVGKCVASIGAFVAGNAVLVAKLRKLGGVAKGARLVIQAGTREEKLKALVAMFGDITGLTTVVSNCS